MAHKHSYAYASNLIAGCGNLGLRVAHSLRANGVEAHATRLALRGLRAGYRAQWLANESA